MSDASDPQQESLRQYLDAEKSRPDPSPEVQQRTMARLTATLGLGAGLGNGPASSAPSDLSSAPQATPRLVRVFARGPHRAWATFLVGAAVGATVYGTVARLRQDPKVVNPPPATWMVAPPASESTAVAPLPVPELPSAVEAGHRPIVTAPSNGRSPGEPAVGGSKDEGLAAERHLIEMARTALARGRLDGALATLHRHARRFAKGQLAEERDSLLVQTLVAKGDYGQAREHATRFRRQHPSSLFQPVVDQALQSIP
jgi:hypothetical protein